MAFCCCLVGCASDGLRLEASLRLPSELSSLQARVERFSLQREGLGLSVDWPTYPTADGWLDVGGDRGTLRWETNTPRVCPLGELTPPTGRFGRAWLDVAANIEITERPAAGLPSTTTEAVDHVEPIAISVRWPEDAGRTLRLELVALRSPTDNNRWALFTAHVETLP